MFKINRICLVVLCFVTIETAKICKVPNGGAGTCVPISRCRPIYDLDNQSYLSEEDNTFIRQAMCGSASSPLTKVCCPPESEWPQFKANPILLPTSAPEHTTKNPNPKPAILTRPTNEVVETIDYGPRELESNGLNQQLTTTPYKGACGVEASSGNKIFGGEAASVDQFPWLVIFQYSGEYLNCGGSIISSRFILTAAHCIESNAFGPPLFVHLGEYNISSYPTDIVETDGGGFETINVTVISVEKVIPHQQFNRTLRINDIGLVKLSRNARFDEFIRPICLPTVDLTPEFSWRTNFTIAGWGSTENKTSSDVKSYVMVPYSDSDVCRRTYPGFALSKTLCAGGEAGKDSCNGDSGGPLMYEINNSYIVVGVLSFGQRICGIAGKPAVYSDVFQHLKWINDMMSTN